MADFLERDIYFNSFIRANTERYDVPVMAKTLSRLGNSFNKALSFVFCFLSLEILLSLPHNKILKAL